MQNGGSASVFPFVRSNAGFLGFGFLMAFVSSGGQTYLIGVFGPEIQAAFSLSHTQWGSYYMIGTLSSSLLLLWSGKLIDSIDLRVYTVFVVLGMAAACLAMGFADSVVGVIGSIFLLRHFGQGLSSHTSVTSMARYFGPNRGKAIALSSMGFSLAIWWSPWQHYCCCPYCCYCSQTMGNGISNTWLKWIPGPTSRKRPAIRPTGPENRCCGNGDSG